MEAWPSVSAVLVTSGRSEALRRAVRSVLGQRYPGRVECVVVFDGREPFDMSDVAPDDGRIDRELVVIGNRRAGGVAGARNAGVDRAFGELIAFCDDDSEWLPGKLLEQVSAMSRSGAPVSVSASELSVGERHHARPLAHAAMAPGVGPAGMSAAHRSAVLVRHDVMVERVGPADETIPGGYGASADWLARAADVVDIEVIPTPLVRVHRDRTPAGPERHLEVLAWVAYLERRRPDWLDRRAASHLYGRAAFACAGLAQFTQARRWAGRAWWRSPVSLRSLLAIAVACRVVRFDRVQSWAMRRGREV